MCDTPLNHERSHVRHAHASSVDDTVGPLSERASRLTVAALIALAWLGLFVHNQISLPLAPLSSENLIPLVVYAALGAWYMWSSDRGTARAAVAGWALVSWALVNLAVGGILTALPLPFLPFVPEQTVIHYAAHGIYSVAQIPLLLSLTRPRSNDPARP